MNKRSIAIFLGGLVSGSVLTGQVLAVQTHMQSALTHLEQAKEQLRLASADKAGHRVKAVGFVDQAISETRLGVKAGAR